MKKFQYKIRPAKKTDRSAMALIYQASYSTVPLSEKWPHAAALKRVSQLLGQSDTAGWAVTVFPNVSIGNKTKNIGASPFSSSSFKRKNGGNQVVGFAFLQSREGFNGAYGELLEASIHPYFRKQGIGGALLTLVRKYQKKKKLKVVYTLAYKGMFERFYKKSGFKPAKRSMIYVWK